MNEHDTDPPDDLAPTSEHLALIAAELPRIARVLPVSVAATGIPPEGHVAFAFDLRSMLGRQMGVAVVGEQLVAHRLRQAIERGIRPSLSAPLPFHEAIPLLEVIGPDLGGRIMARPPNTMTVVVVDQDDNPALLFCDPLDDEDAPS